MNGKHVGLESGRENTRKRRSRQGEPGYSGLNSRILPLGTRYPEACTLTSHIPNLMEGEMTSPYCKTSHPLFKIPLCSSPPLPETLIYPSSGIAYSLSLDRESSTGFLRRIPKALAGEAIIHKSITPAHRITDRSHPIFNVGLILRVILRAQNDTIIQARRLLVHRVIL